jgi:hypothetical protein
MRLWVVLSRITSFICSKNDVNVSSFKNKHKRIDDVSLKLWHHHLGYILRGRIKCLVKESILSPLEFLDFKQCIDCIKANTLSKLRKTQKINVGILEIIHTDI